LVDAHLWCQVKSQITAASQSVLDQQRNIRRQAEFDSAGQPRGFAEVDEILEREAQGNRVCELDLDIQVRLLDVRVAAKCDSSVSNITSTSKLDTVL
jgi:hypothetical protein